MNTSEIRDIPTLRKFYVEHSGFSGGWNVLLENFSTQQASYPYSGHGPMMVVSQPVQSGCWMTREFGGLAVEQPIGGRSASLAEKGIRV